MYSDTQARARLKVQKWVPFMNPKEAARWKKEGSAEHMKKLHK